MHLGNVRTALFNALIARGSQGVFLLRIEDTDKIRSVEDYTQALLEDLRWLGLDWQEGPEVGGSAGPYWQSQRQAIYDTYYKQLEQKQLAYPCFCTDAQLELTRKLQQAAGQPPRYPGTCRHLTAAEVAEKLAQGLMPTLRFLVPRQQLIEFNDLARGMQRFQSDDIGDFIIRRADRTASFLFSNAVDDALMGVTHALRGEDHLTNTPRQLLLMQALQLNSPTYGHISMIVGADGSPLSKRNGSLSVRELKQMGYLPEAVNNYLARLGHYYESPEFMDLATLSKNFSSDALGSTPAHYDASQLMHWQKEALARCSGERLWEWVGADVHHLVPAAQQTEFINTVRHNLVFPEDGLDWAKIFYDNPLLYTDDARALLAQTDPQFFVTASTAVTEHGNDFKTVSGIIQQQLSVKGKGLYHPLRAGLTGRLDGPEMVGIFNLLGKTGLIKRFTQAAEILKKA